MNWEVAGVIAEIVGAIAVVVTLMYLAIQTRQARIAAEQSAKFAVLQGSSSVIAAYSRWRSILLDKPELIEAITKLNSGIEISEVERIQVAVAFEELFLAAGLSYMSGVVAGSMHSSAADVEYLVEYFASNPSAKQEWHRRKSMWNKTAPEFVSAIDDELAKDE